MKTVSLICYNDGKKIERIDNVVDEHNVKLKLNRKEFFTFQTYPLHMDELVTGFLYSQGYISSIEDLKGCSFDEKIKEYKVNVKNEIVDLEIDIRNRRVASLSKDSFLLKAQTVIELMTSFLGLSEIFEKTGAVHTAAIANTSEIEYFYDDIGRHNAIDKCLGKALKSKLDLEHKILIVTCRMSSGIIKKLVNTKVPMIISRASPTFSAIDLARKNYITMIGFCRGVNFNIYSHSHRINTSQFD